MQIFLYYCCIIFALDSVDSLERGIDRICSQRIQVVHSSLDGILPGKPSINAVASAIIGAYPAFVIIRLTNGRPGVPVDVSGDLSDALMGCDQITNFFHHLYHILFIMVCGALCSLFDDSELKNFGYIALCMLNIIEIVNPPANLSEGSWFQIIFFKKRRCKKCIYANIQTLAHFVDNPQFYGIVGTVDDIAYGGFWHAAFHIQLILRHVSFIQQFREALAYRQI